jgi:hypothetical protein
MTSCDARQGFIEAPTKAIRFVVVSNRRIVASLSPSALMTLSYRRQSNLGSARIGRAAGSLRRAGRALGGGGGRSSSDGSAAGSWLGVL